MANTYLSRTFGSAGNRKTWTWSGWIKRATLGANQSLFSCHTADSDTAQLDLKFDSGDTISYEGKSTVFKTTSRVFRDTSAWYHIMFVLDMTQATASDRMKIYVNGVLETSFATDNTPAQNTDLGINQNSQHVIGMKDRNTDAFFSGSMSHVHFIDGTAYDATAFGEYDANGVWKIKTSPSVTYGTNGFFILKDGNSVTDQSGEGNDFTVGGGTLTNTEDNPSNVFATLNSLNVPTSNLPTFSNGNTTSVTSTSGSGKWGGSTTLGMTSGKFYCEAKATIDVSSSRSVIGITGDSANMARDNGSPLISDQTSSGFYSETGRVTWNTVEEYTAGAYATNDIIQIAIDLDNNRLFYGKNGTWLNSGNPTSSTGAITITGADTTNDGAYFFCQADDTAFASVSKFEFNFGNGYFGTTAVASAGTNASGIGIFEYDVPTGYTALSTKGLNL